MASLEDVLDIYARSLYEVSCETKQEELFFNEMMFLKDILSESLELIDILKVPTINKSEKKKIIENIFVGKVNECIVNFMKVLIDNNKIALILKISDKYKELYYKGSGIAEVEVISAVELSEYEKKKVVEKCEILLKKKIKTLYVVDQKIVGGLIIKANNQIYDVSLKTKMDGLKKAMVDMVIN